MLISSYHRQVEMLVTSEEDLSQHCRRKTFRTDMDLESSPSVALKSRHPALRMAGFAAEFHQDSKYFQTCCDATVSDHAGAKNFSSRLSIDRYAYKS